VRLDGGCSIEARTMISTDCRHSCTHSTNSKALTKKADRSRVDLDSRTLPSWTYYMPQVSLIKSFRSSTASGSWQTNLHSPLLVLYVGTVERRVKVAGTGSENDGMAGDVDDVWWPRRSSARATTTTSQFRPSMKCCRSVASQATGLGVEGAICGKLLNVVGV